MGVLRLSSRAVCDQNLEDSMQFSPRGSGRAAALSEMVKNERQLFLEWC
jgi:hypothetical protein